MFNELFSKIENIIAISEAWEETWGSLLVKGHYKQQYSKTVFQELYNVLDNIGKAEFVYFKIGNSAVAIDELECSLAPGIQWTVNINKQSFMGEGVSKKNFFYDLGSFKKWATDTNPFSTKNPFNKYRCSIEVNGLQNSFGGPNFLVSSNIDNNPDHRGFEYQPERLMTTLRQFTNVRREIHPEKHYVAYGDVDEYSLPFYRNSLKSLSLALCDELYDETVVLRGIRRLEFRLLETQYDNVEMAISQECLREAFCWVFGGDERYELRHKLLMDRLTLDLPQNQSFYEGILPLLNQATKQAAERYNYAFFERANEYQKELQQFLKELHNLSDSYSAKLQSFLDNFLRDALAGLLTVAITVFAQIQELETLNTSNVLDYIFCTFAGYLLISCAAQTFVDWRDLTQFEKEIDYWKLVSREYMRDEDFDYHKKNTIEVRKRQAIKQYILIGSFYVALAIFSICVPKFYKEKLLLLDSEVELNIEDSVNKTKDILTLDSLQNGTVTFSGINDTTVCHPYGGK